MSELDYIEIGRRIRQAREDKNLTLADLAAEIGLNKSTILRYESGEIRRIKLPILEAIASALGVNPSWLSLETDDPTNYDDMTDEIPDYIVDHFDGDIEQAAKAWLAMDEDVAKSFSERDKLKSKIIELLEQLTDEEMKEAARYLGYLLNSRDS